MPHPIAPWPTCADLCDRFESVQAFALDLHHYGARRVFDGRVYTVDCRTGMQSLRALVQQQGKGRVLVVDGGGPATPAVFGDTLAALAIRHDWQGVVINGCVRDVSILASMDIGVMALGTHPRRANLNGPGASGLPLTFGGIQIPLDTTLVADTDGAVLLPPSIEWHT